MNSSPPPDHPPSPRLTLKLKSGKRELAKEKTPAVPSTPPRESKAKPGSHWSDEYKERMQAEMNALASPSKHR